MTCDGTRACVVRCRRQSGWPWCTMTLTESFWCVSLRRAHVWSGISVLKENKWSVFLVISPLQPNDFLNKCFFQKMASYTHKMAVCKHTRGHYKPVWLQDFPFLVSTRHMSHRPVVSDELDSSRVTLPETRPSVVIRATGHNKRISDRVTWQLCLTDPGFTKLLHNHEIIITQLS